MEGRWRKIMRSSSFSLGLSVVYGMGLACPGEGQASPAIAGHVVVLANGNSEESLDVAQHYARQRGVPDSHILRLDLPNDETMAFEEYETSVVKPVRNALQSKGLTAQVRILVTTYGIPLRLREPEITQEEQLWLNDAREWEQAAESYLEELEREVQSLGFSQSGDSEAQGFALGRSEDNPDVLQRIGTAMTRAQHRVLHLPPEEKEAAFRKFSAIVRKVNGLSAVVPGAAVSVAGPDHAGMENLARLQRNIQTVQEQLTWLKSIPSTKTRERAYQLAQRFFGLAGVLQLARQEIDRFAQKDGASSLDSELSLLWWDRSMYGATGRFPNPLYAWDRSSNNGARNGEVPVMMVSRLDAPSAALAKQMVDQALVAERTGLTGTVYLDARGLKPGKPLSYGYYDQNLRDLSQSLGKITAYPLRLDNTPDRFRHRGDAPDVALYVGWYRLRAYEDAFAFNPGAIGYHIASGEAVSVHNPHERGWCKNALERGITVTLGPVGEPYLDAFPLPTEFVGLLLTGRYTLVEAYYLSLRYLSWKMVLFGDPLYNPWRGRALESKVLTSGMLKLQQLPPQLIARPMADPLTLRAQWRSRQQQILSQFAVQP